MNGSRLEPEHLKTKKKEKIYKWEISETLPSFRFVYNDKQVFLLRKKEIKQLKKAKNILKFSYSKSLKKKNAFKKLFKKRDLKYLSLGRRLSIEEGPARTKEERDKKIIEIDSKNQKILKMSLKDYLNYLNGRDKKENQNNDDENSLFTVSGEIEERLEKLEAIIKKGH